MKAQKRVLHNIQNTRKPSRAGHLGKFPRRNVIDPDQFADARRFSGLSREDAAELLGVSLRTVGHWETGKVRVSYAAFKLLRVYRHGDLIDPTWSGFKLRKGRLVTPEGHSFEPGDVSWLTLLVRRAKLVTEVVAQRDALRAQVDALKASFGEAERRLGLVYYKTSGRSHSEPLVYQGFRGNLPVAFGANVVPTWQHGYSRQTEPRTAQSTPAARSEGAVADLRRYDGYPAEYSGYFGPSQFHALFAVEGTAATRQGEVTSAGQAAGKTETGGMAVSGCEAPGQGWPERSLPLWQWSQGEAMPFRVHLTGAIH
jgi:DNA-binding transcriptional regulator YiaG